MNKISGFVFLLASMSLLESVGLADNYTITGKIKEYRSLKPISNAKVSFVYDGGGEISVTSDEKGNYTIKPELNKAGNLVVNAENYREYKTSYSAVSYNRDYRINNIDLEFDYFTINGHVFDYVTLDPIKDAEVTLVFEYGEGQSATVKTDEAGRYSLRCALGKNGTLQIIKDGYIDNKNKISAQGAGAVLNNYNYEMRPKVETWTINGKVIENKTWFPITGAEVGFTYNDGGQVASVTTDALGNFQIKPLINKNGSLVIKAKDFKPYITSFSGRGSGREIYKDNYKMSHNYWTLCGTLVDYKTNDPAAGVSVQCIYDKASEKIEAVKTDEKGFYTLKIDADKSGTLEFSGDEWVTRKENFSGRGSDDYAIWNYEINKKDETFVIKGRVTERFDRNYIEGAKVSFVYDKGGEVSATTDKLGYYSLCPLINNAGKITITKDNYLPFIGDSIARDNARTVENWDYNLAHNYWTLTGKIVDYKTGDGIKDATLSFFYEDGSKIDCTTDENGNYKITPENDKRGKIVISAEGYITRKEGETSRSADGFEVWNYDIKKEKETYTIVGRVFSDKDKKPLAGAVVEYTAKDGTKVSATTDENGDYVIDAPLNQEGSFKVTAQGFKEGVNSIGKRTDSRNREVYDFYLSK